VEPGQLLAYVYLAKTLLFQTAFSISTLKFGDKWVKSFSAPTANQRKQVALVKYESNLKFVVRLKLDKSQDELFLCKGYSEIPELDTSTET
jgi:hypothetical protein